MHKQQGWLQAWEYCQAKPIQTLGRASQGVNWSWSLSTHIERVFLIWSHSCSTLTSVPAWPETSHTDSSDCCPHCCSDASKLWKNENHILSQSKVILQSPTLIDPNDIVLTQKGLFRFKCIFEPLRLQRVLYHLTGQRKNGVTSL